MVEFFYQFNFNLEMLFAQQFILSKKTLENSDAFKGFSRCGGELGI